MCNKGGSPPVPNQTSTAYQAATSPSSVAMPYYSNFLANASNLSQTPFNPAMYGSVAPLNPTEFQAGQYMTDAMGLMPGAVSNLMDVGKAMGTFDPAQVRAIESPYTQDVVQATQDWFNNQNAIQGTDLMSQAIRTGNAFGGDRAGIAEAQLAGQQQLAQAPVIAGLRQAGYTQALNEYNQLKQMGLTGAEAALGAPMQEMQGAGALMGWGTQQQQQAQRELDVAQQNAMMASAYPFQTANWYGSILGGIAPLTGTFAQGYTTPPPPNAIAQAAGIASAIAGLGSAFAGKHGGVVPMRARGGLVPIIVPRRFVGGPVIARRQIGGLVPVWGAYNGGLLKRAPRQGLGMFMPPRRQGGGTVDGASTNIDFGTTGGQPGAGPTLDLSGGYGTTAGFSGSAVDNPDRRRIGLNPLTIQTYKGGPPDAGDWIQRQMRAAKSGQQQQPSNDLASTIGSVAKLATKAAPLFAMLERGGAVKRYANGDSVDDDDDDDDETIGAGTAAVPAALPAQLVASGPGPTTTTPRSPEDGEHEPGGLPTPQEAVTGRLPESVTDARAQAGLTPGGRGYGTRTIPGLGLPPRTFAQRLANDPLWNLGMGLLSSHSPYLGQGVAAGMYGMSQAADRQRKEDLLDQKPQMIDDGKSIKYRVGNKIIDTGLGSARGAVQTRQEALENLRQQHRLELEQKRGERGGRGAPGQAEATNRFHMRQLQTQLKTALGDNPDMSDPDVIAKTRQAIQNYNQMWGTNFNVPEAPPAGTAAPAKPSGGGFWNWLGTALFGSSAPAAPAKADETPAAPATVAPATPAAPQQQGQQAAPPDPIAQGRQLRDRIVNRKMTADQAMAQARAAIQQGASRVWVNRMLQEAGLPPLQ